MIQIVVEVNTVGGAVDVLVTLWQVIDSDRMSDYHIPHVKPLMVKEHATTTQPYPPSGTLSSGVWTSST